MHYITVNYKNLPAAIVPRGKKLKQAKKVASEKIAEPVTEILTNLYSG